MSTINLQLNTNSFPADDDKRFEVWLEEMAGMSNSNMTKIDDFAGETDSTFTNIKGVGWTNQTIKGNADGITALNSRVTYTATATGTNTLTVTIPQITSPLANAILKIIPTANNTGAMTLNVNTEGALPITKIRTVSGSIVYEPMVANDFRNGSQVLVTKSPDSIRWISLSHSEVFARNLYYDNGGGVFTTVQTELANKVNKAGDTMTGNLNVTTINSKTPAFASLPSETVISTGFSSGWSGTLKVRISQENKKSCWMDVTKTSDISTTLEEVYALTGNLTPLTGGACSIVGLTSGGSFVQDSSLYISVATNLRLASTGRTTVNVRRIIASFEYY